MVDWYSLKGISPQANAAQSAQLQAIQTAVAGELDAKQARLQALGYIVPKVVEVGGQLLDRRSKRKAAEAEAVGSQEFYKNLGDLVLGPENAATYGNAAPLELESQPLDELNYKKKPDGSFALGAQEQTVPQVDPKAVALRNVFNSATAAGFRGKDLAIVLQAAALTDYTPQGMKDIYGARDVKAEFESKEGLENGGIKSRRNVDRDLDLSKTRADIANTYDTINKRVMGGSKGSSDKSPQGKIARQARLIGNVMNGYITTLNSINEKTPLGPVQRLWDRGLAEARFENESGIQSKALAGLRKRLRVEVARLGEVGNLTKDEQLSAEGLLPNPLDSIKQQQESLKQLQMYLEAKAEEPLELLEIESRVSGKVLPKVSSKKPETAYDELFGD